MRGDEEKHTFFPPPPFCHACGRVIICGALLGGRGELLEGVPRKKIIK